MIHILPHNFPFFIFSFLLLSFHILSISCDDNPDEDDEKGLKIIVISISAVTGTIFCLLLLACIYVFIRIRSNPYTPLDVKDNLSISQFNMGGSDVIIGEMIGTGSFGQVYKGTWRSLDVAVKRLPDVFKPDQHRDFVKEIQLLSMLRHPNIVQFLGAVTIPPNPFLVTEFMSKGSLHSILHESSFSVSWKRLKDIAIDSAKGMNYLHTNTPIIIHRDLKSHNILVDETWRAK
eukprot:TRINITY_DN417_c0_g1_i3.p1 TRINITY_DN417_c0_g1~~TRINITY_DN417_c0_g1_i3.p1  ORF type:complete len:233 (-),score=24.91 TRINITY_DN417_c0_g1_i3:557-1255(-)